MWHFSCVLSIFTKRPSTTTLHLNRQKEVFFFIQEFGCDGNLWLVLWRYIIRIRYTTLVSIIFCYTWCVGLQRISSIEVRSCLLKMNGFCKRLWMIKRVQYGIGSSLLMVEELVFTSGVSFVLWYGLLSHWYLFFHVFLYIVIFLQILKLKANVFRMLK